MKTNDKIRDQLLNCFVYFSNLMHANIDGLKIHSISTEKPLPILTFPKDKNIPTTGNKIKDYFFHTEPVIPCPQNAKQVDADAISSLMKTASTMDRIGSQALC
jgi:hypothetical protein